MLKLTPLDLIIIGIPESLLIFLLIYSLAKKKVDKKSYIQASAIQATAQYFIRMLPINYGVHTVLAMVLTILLLVYLIRLPIIKAITYTIIAVIIVALSEEFYMAILINIIKVDFKSIAGKTMISTFYVFPYLIFVGAAVVVIRRMRKAKD